jgi:hypothetical protein
MKLFKDSADIIYAYEEDGSQDHFIGDKVSIAQTEADSINAAKYQQLIAGYGYAQKRAMEYPPMADYLDGVVKGDQAQIDKYIADCQTIKAKYPKV